MKRIFWIVAMALVGLTASAQRRMENLDRGLVAMPSLKGDSTYVSWRMFGTEYYDVAWNLYRNGVKVNDAPLTVSNFLYKGTDKEATWSVAPVFKGKEGARSKAVKAWTKDYLEIPLADVFSRRGTKITQNYVPNDCCAADMDGDGEMEIIVKRINNMDWDDTGARPLANDSAFNFFEVYKLDGTLLWRVDCGPNVCSIGDVELNMVAYDWDGDGQAEAVLRVGDDAIIHKADGTLQTIGKAGRNYRDQMNHGGAYAYTRVGEEYLVYMNGATGEPYVVMDFPLKRLEDGETNQEWAWGDDYGHRSSKYFFGAPYLDGRKPSIFLARGIYTRHKMIAYDVDPATHQLVERWRWFNNTAGPWFGQGYHNYSIADVDMDGRDEIVFGSMVIDDNGQGLSTCGLGHGDAHHCGDFDPYNHGLEIFCCNEDKPACNYRDATTSAIFYRLAGGGDDGRCMFGNFTDKYPGAEGRSNHSDLVGGAYHDAMPGADWTGIGNIFRIYWDGDLLEELQGGTAIAKYGAWDSFKDFTGCVSCNGTKGTPCLTADLLGDWREEVVLGTSNGKALRIYHTQHYTPWRNYTLMHDHQYRNGVVWEMCGYNQPPHASYFLGNLENITVAPAPLISNERTVVEPGGTVTKAMDGQHVLLAPQAQDADLASPSLLPLGNSSELDCSRLSAAFTIEDGAQPYILTVNAPSWVQGHTNNDNITRDYYTYNVTSGVLSGDMRLVKQGDGELRLNKNTHTYTGETKVWAGTLAFDGELTNSPLELYFFSALKSDGGKFQKGITMRYDSRIEVGKQGVTTTTLDMEFGARLVFNLYEDGTASCLKADKITMQTVNWKYGPKVQRPVIEFVQHKTAGKREQSSSLELPSESSLGEAKTGDRMATGRYCIIDAPELNVDLKDIIVEGMSGTKYKLVYENGRLYIDILPFREATTLAWTGAESGNWDFDITSNFATEDGKAMTFVTGDKIVFDDRAQQTAIKLTDELLADEIIFRNNTKDYIINPTSPQTFIGSTARLIKEGDGKLTINSVNRYEGGTIIRGGTLQVATMANKFEQYGGLGLRTDEPGKILLENGGRLNVQEACNLGSPIVAGEGGGVFANFQEMEVQRPFSGTSITKAGGGRLRIFENNGRLRKWICNGGTTELCNDGIYFADTLEMRSGTFKDYDHSGTYSAFRTPIVVPEGCTATFDTDSRCEYFCKLLGAGTLKLNVRWIRQYWSGDFSKFTGTLVITGDAVYAITNGYGMPLGTLDISNGNYAATDRTYRVGRVKGDKGILSGGGTWQIGWNGEDWTYGGTIADTGTKLEKVGNNNVTLTGASTYGGTTTVKEGTLTINGAQLGTGTLTVNKSARMIAKNTAAKALTNKSLTISGELLIGTEGNHYTGSLFLGGADASFGTSSKLKVGVRRAASKTNNGSTCLEGVGKLTFKGTLEVEMRDGTELAEGDSIRVWVAEKYASTSAPKFSFIGQPGEGLTWDTSRISEGLLFVVKDDSDAIQPATAATVRTEYFTLDGVQTTRPQRGVCLVREHHADGTVTTRKQMFR